MYSVSLYRNNAIIYCNFYFLQPEITARSCLDYLKRGFDTNGFYTIYDFNSNDFVTVYCDMTSEPGSAWTLVMSYSLKNRGMLNFARKAMPENEPVNENSPNWNLYRMSLPQMTHLKSQSTRWRVTCSFSPFGVDYTDYVRAKFTDFDILTFLGRGICMKVEFVNIRGHQCAQCTTRWWQIKGVYAPHIDSTAKGCQLVPSHGAVNTENNFGYYIEAYNNKFRCSANSLSTTNWWFGGNL